MSSSPPTFIGLAVEGRISSAQIDDFVDRWHEEHCGRHLHDYLGLTRPEYALWLVEPDMLSVIVKARAEGVSLPALVSDELLKCRADGTAVDLARVSRLDRWLAEQTARD